MDQADIELLRAERNAAIWLIANWCVDIDHNGTGWDDWDENYKDAMYRPGMLRKVLDEAIAEVRKQRGIDSAYVKSGVDDN